MIDHLVLNLYIQSRGNNLKAIRRSLTNSRIRVSSNLRISPDKVEAKEVGSLNLNLLVRQNLVQTLLKIFLMEATVK